MSATVDLAQGIGTITLSQPPLNILTRRLLEELRGRLEELTTAPDLRVLLV